MTFPKFKSIFYRAVAAYLLVGNGDKVNFKFLFQLFAKVLREVRHFIKTPRTFRPKPFVNLLSAKRLFAHFSYRFHELFLTHFSYVCFLLHSGTKVVKVWVLVNFFRSCI